MFKGLSLLCNRNGRNEPAIRERPDASSRNKGLRLLRGCLARFRGDGFWKSHRTLSQDQCARVGSKAPARLPGSSRNASSITFPSRWSTRVRSTSTPNGVPREIESHLSLLRSSAPECSWQAHHGRSANGPSQSTGRAPLSGVRRRVSFPCCFWL